MTDGRTGVAEIVAGIALATFATVATFAVIGVSLVTLIPAIPIGILAFSAGYFFARGRRSRSALEPPSSPDGSLVSIGRDVAKIEAIRGSLGAAKGRDPLGPIVEGAHAVLKRLEEEGRIPSPAMTRMVQGKIQTCLRIIGWYRDLLNGDLLAMDDAQQLELVMRIEQEALPKIAGQLVHFARTLDSDEIGNLDIELTLLDELSG